MRVERVVVEPTASGRFIYGGEAQQDVGDQLQEWIESGTATTDLPSLSRFAQYLERALAAVTADLSQPWNSSVVEYPVNRIKMLKR